MTYYDGDPATLVGPLVGFVLLFAGAVLYARLRNPSARRAAARRITAIDGVRRGDMPLLLHYLQQRGPK